MAIDALVVVGWVVSPVIRELVCQVKTLVTRKHKIFKDFSKQIDELDHVLDQIKETVDTVQGQRVNESSRMVSHLMDAINEMEDILSAFVYGDILLSDLARKHKVRRVVHSTVRTGRRLIGRDKTFGRFKELLDKLSFCQVQGLLERPRDLVLLSQLQATRSRADRGCSMSRSATGPLLWQDKLFGYKEEYDQLVSALLNDPPASSSGGGNRDAQVVAVIGNGGAGKTAIAQWAWKNDKVYQHFDLPIWVSVSKFSKPEQLLTEIWRSVPEYAFKCAGKEEIQLQDKECAAEMSFSSLQQNLARLVKSKRYLLVLDGVCNDELAKDHLARKKTWEDVLAPFKHGSQGSRILMTTRAKICSKTLNAGTKIMLNGIGTDELLLLLKKSAFGDENICVPMLDEVLRSVAEKLKGSPIAAKSVAEKVRNKHRRKDWEEIFEAGYLSGETSSAISTHESSYQDLPQHLQCCLAFCSIFPNKYEFEREKLIGMWIAHGIISDNRSDGKSMEDVGRDYIRDLLSRSFFQGTKHGKATHFVIHEQIHLMLLSVSANYFCRIVDNNGSIRRTVRHLSVTNGCLAQLKKHAELKKLRTLLVFDGQSSPLSAIDNDVLKELKAVRVLDLSGTSITDLPKGIGKLKHLRYLGLPNALKRLPAAVTKLLHLQTLALGKHCELDEFPADGMDSLIHLRNLDMDMKYIAMISGIGRLDKLQGSVEFCADMGQGHGMEELAGMNCLRGTLNIKGLQDVANKEAARKAQLGRKEFVKVLKLEWEPKLGTSSTSSYEQVLEGFQPNHKIEELHIRRYQGTSSPSWLENRLLTNLRYLYLINCRNWQALPPLSQLRDLKVLRIKEMWSVHRIDHGSGVFRSLEKLVLDDMPNLVEWIAELSDVIFPRLQEMYILNCPKLEKLPRVPSAVKNMKIEKHNSYCMNLSSLKSNSFTLEVHGDAVQLLHEDFLHQHHIAAVSAVSIKQYKGSSEANIKLLSSVQSLTLSRCVKPDRLLSMCLQKSKSLERLQISDCCGFHAFPEDAMLSSLKSLELKGCHPELMKKLRDKTGPTWAKICSIPQLHID